jgi:peptidoglycan/LPS O-acetylase OafA/YrhL
MSERYQPLDGLRATSIVLVLAAHLLPLGPKWLELNSAAGAMGMAIFFSLSGFLITQNLLGGQSVRTFFVRRAARILPLAYLYLLIASLIVWPSPGTLVQNLLFVENYTYDWVLDNHFWSLCAEVHFYLAIGLTVLLLGKRGVLFIPLACLAITALRIWHGATIDIQTHLRIDEICIGGSVAIALHYRALEKAASSPLAFTAVALLLTISSWDAAGWLQYVRPYSSGTLLALALVLRPCTLRRALISNAAAYVANISYSLYVIHPITAHGFMDDGTAAIKYLVKRPLSLATTFILAHLSTFYFESRFIRLAKTITSGSQVAKTAEGIVLTPESPASSAAKA